MMFGGMFLFWVILVIGIVWFVKYMGDQRDSRNDKPESTKSALGILRDRYARGEISKEEFEDRKQVLIQ